jgi:purine-binding chemotaxis protein CheW
VKIHVLLFWLGSNLYAISTSPVREVLPIAALTAAPGQPPIIRGFLNVRGSAVPVIRLRRLFGFDERDPRRYTPLILVDSGSAMLALEVDALEEVVEHDEAATQPLAAGHSANDCAEGMIAWNGREAILLSFKRLLLAQEMERVRALQGAMQERLNALAAEVQ